VLTPTHRAAAAASSERRRGVGSTGE
jgi:hypothetical protein